MNSLKDLWNRILDCIISKNKYTEATYNLWFKELILYKLNSTTAYIAVEHKFRSDIIKGRYIGDIKEGMEEILGFPVEIELFIAEDMFKPDIDLDKMLEEAFSNYITQKVNGATDLSPEIHTESSAAKQEEPAYDEFAEQEEETTTHSIESLGVRINPEYTFDKFVVGSTNKFAYNACLNVADFPSQNYNPLYIYGASGLGKTHLLYAIANHVAKKHPGFNALYVRGEDFANELIDNISTKRPMSYFRDKYRTVDMILIDDIHFIAGKVSSQEEFFHTFNALHEQQKQIVLSSDLPPKELKTLEERLKTRFEWGLMVDIQPPDMELRMAILKNKARSYGTELSDDILMFLAENVKNNIRQLEGAVRKINAYCLLSGSKITLDKVKELVDDLFVNELPPNYAFDKVMEMVCSRYGVTTDDILSSKRNQEIVHARHVCIYYMRTTLDMTFPAIGKKLNMHHSTVMTGNQKIEGRIKSNSAFEAEIKELEKEIQRAISN
ncbi:MAG: chromosomal replication initiator protein DnaA [Clostridia bacterium]|nr:chromosomal replication initiator protein DnaA [Clostridia bacterium]